MQEKIKYTATYYEQLLTQLESNYIDFKQQWYADTIDLILDILCMANSDAKSDRYLIIGYKETEKKFCDISVNRKNRDDLSNILSTAGFNRVPEVYIETTNISGNEIDIIIVKKTNYRPYSLLKDKRHSAKIIRAGVIYTRNGSVNTPINESASENQVADMWRERFGLTLSPKERLAIYVQDYKNWKHTCDENYQLSIWHYEPFPEFTIEYSIPKDMSDYSNPPERAGYVFAHSIGNSYETNIRYKYRTTILQTESLFICDKQRYIMLTPHTDWLYYHHEDLTDIHVFANNSHISDRGKTLTKVDCDSKGKYRQVTFFYNIKNSFEYYVQRILNFDSAQDIYIDYSFNYSGCSNSTENKNITCPSTIYLLESSEDIAIKLRAEFVALQKRTSKN